MKKSKPKKAKLKTREEAPWIVWEGEPCATTNKFIRGLRRKQVLTVVVDTYTKILSFDDVDYNKLFDSGILTEVDRAQDTEVVRKLSLGLCECERLWPLTFGKARRFVERTLAC